MQKLFSIILVVLCINVKSQEQYHFPEMGQYSDEEIKMTNCSFEKDAVAIILLDAAISKHHEGFKLITQHRTRIKILTNKGLQYANISIHFLSKDNFEKITNIEAITVNPGEPVIVLDKTQLFKETVNERVSRIRFTHPGVKVGSIIEYEYTSEIKNYGGLRDWVFQGDIPTLKSCYFVTLAPNSEFSYILKKKKEYTIKVTPYESAGKLYFEMNEIPALVDEPYMNSGNDYLQKVEFKLNNYKNLYGGTVKVNDSWAGLAKDLSEHENLGNSFKKNFKHDDDLKEWVSKETTDVGKLKVIYKYVQKFFRWNRIDTKLTTEDLKKVYDKKSGTSGELNLLLVNLLKNFGIEAYPMLVAERSFGKVVNNFPSFESFNKTVAYSFIDGNVFILDVTDPYCPPQLIPYSMLNTYALIINPATKGLVYISTDTESFSSIVNINSTIDKNGKLTGNTVFHNSSYAALYYWEQVRRNETKFIEKLSEDNDQPNITNFNSTDIRSFEDTLKFNFHFEKDVKDNNNYVLLAPSFFFLMNKNPFTRDIRFSDINFGYPINISIQHKLVIPENTAIEIPKNKTIYNERKDISLSRSVEKNGNELSIVINFSQSATLFNVADYPMLQKFYNEMLSFLKEPVVIKL